MQRKRHQLGSDIIEAIETGKETSADVSKAQTLLGTFQAGS